MSRNEPEQKRLESKCQTDSFDFPDPPDFVLKNLKTESKFPDGNISERSSKENESDLIRLRRNKIFHLMELIQKSPEENFTQKERVSSSTSDQLPEDCIQSIESKYFNPEDARNFGQPKALTCGQEVLIFKPVNTGSIFKLSKKWSGPFIVVKQKQNNFYELPKNEKPIQATYFSNSDYQRKLSKPQKSYY